jgi:hypothetical protein
MAMLNFMLEDWQVYTYLAVFVCSILGSILFLFLGAPLIIPRLKAVITRKHMILLGTAAGKGQFKALKEFAGWLRDKKEDFEITPRSITKLPFGLDIFVGHNKLGLTIPLEGAAAIAHLNRMGYASLADALNAYDDQWFQTNAEAIKAAVDKANAAITDPQKAKVNEYMVYDEYRQAGRTVLVKLQWITPFTIPLSILYNYSLQTVSAQNNKIIVDAAVQDEREKRTGAKDLGKFIVVAGIIMCILIAGAVAVNILPKQCTNTVERVYGNAPIPTPTTQATGITMPYESPVKIG